MSSSEKAGHGRGNNRKRSHRRRYADNDSWQKGSSAKKNNENTREEKVAFIERLKWSPPQMSAAPLPNSVCPWCGKPIRDMISAIADKDTGVPVHFECVTARIAFGEKLEKGEVIAYIGGGRFGIVCFGASLVAQLGDVRLNPSQGVLIMDSNNKALDQMQAGGRQYRGSAPGNRDFSIKKIIEWENKDKRAEWRSVICDHYSIT